MKTRRRFLAILAGVAALPVLGGAATAATRQWRGLALGANAQIVLDHPNAEALIDLAICEIRRLEQIFSLYRADSSLSRLNQTGSLLDPPFEMVELLSSCTTIHQRTGGAFDPTVQPLWAFYARQYSRGVPPEKAQIAAALALTGWDNVEISAAEIRLARPGMALTLNGVAQGYIADKVTELLRRNGISNVMVNAGEISALGTSPAGTPWEIFLKGGGKPLQLVNQAVATSAPLGTVFTEAGKAGHILDPRRGLSGGKWRQVSVIASNATLADGLSTGFCLMDRNEIMAALGAEQVVLTGLL
jgi:FAD:protein FMN transferase